jgi:hypothetical protein
MSISRIVEYLQATGWYLWGALAALTATERYIERLWPDRCRKQLDLWTTPQRRRQILLAMALIAFVVGNFRAWNEEREARSAAEQKVANCPLDECWAALTAVEQAALAERVRSITPMNIMVGCETVRCRDLADGIATILLNTPGWKVKVVHNGGLDISGVSGIMIDPDEPTTRHLKDAIERSTTLRVTMGPDTREQAGSSPSTLTVGTKPF